MLLRWLNFMRIIFQTHEEYSYSSFCLLYSSDDPSDVYNHDIFLYTDQRHSASINGSPNMTC